MLGRLGKLPQDIRGSGLKNKEDALNAITAARETYTDVEAVGGLNEQQRESIQGKIDEAEQLLTSNPLAAIQAAEEASDLASQSKEENLSAAHAQAEKAISDAEASLAAAAPGSDLAETQANIAKAKELKDSARSVSELSGDTDSVVFYANAAKQQAEAASLAKSQSDALAAQQKLAAEKQQATDAMYSYVKANSGLTDFQIELA